MMLVAERLSVAFGGVRAIDDVSLAVAPALARPPDREPEATGIEARASGRDPSAPPGPASGAGDVV